MISLFKFLAVSAALLLPTYADVVETDVLVIGGGAAGTYTAVRLHQEGKSVILVEKNDILGGHVNTWYSEPEQIPVDHGVQVYLPLPVVENYFKYLDVPYFLFNETNQTYASSGASFIVDYELGRAVNQASLPSSDLTPLWELYLDQLAKYPWIDQGFRLPTPVPSDLLLPFGQFLANYNISGLATIISRYNQGAGNILAQPTLYMIKYMHAVTVNCILTGCFVQTQWSANQKIYDSAQKLLGSQAYVSSIPGSISRNSDGIIASIQSPQGAQLVKAKKLVVAIQPKVENLQFLASDLQEQSVFSQFNNSFYYTSMIHNSGIPNNVSTSRFSFSAPDNVPAQPGSYAISSSPVPGYHSVYYGSTTYMSDAEVQQNIAAEIEIIRKAGNFSAPTTGPLEFIDFYSHSPFELTVSVDAIQNGFYDQANALQGHLNTWWTGAAWQAQDSSMIMNFTETFIIPELLKD